MTLLRRPRPLCWPGSFHSPPLPEGLVWLSGTPWGPADSWLCASGNELSWSLVRPGLVGLGFLLFRLVLQEEACPPHPTHPQPPLPLTGPASCPVSPTPPCSDQVPLPRQPRLPCSELFCWSWAGMWRLLPSLRLAREAQAYFRSLNCRNTTPSAVPKKCGPVPAFVGHALQVVRGHPRGHPFRDDSCPSWCLGLLPSVCPLTRPPMTVSLCLAPSVDFQGHPVVSVM